MIEISEVVALKGEELKESYKINSCTMRQRKEWITRNPCNGGDCFCFGERSRLPY